MHPADGVILAIIAISMLFGIFRGLVREAFALAGWIAAYVVAQLFHMPMEAMLEPYIETPSLRLVTAWGGLFVVTLLLAALTGYMIRSLMESAGLSGIDRTLGAIFGIIRGLIVVLALLIVAAPFVSRDRWWQEARLPREFMRYELVGRELKQKLTQAARSVGSERPAERNGDAGSDEQQ